MVIIPLPFQHFKIWQFYKYQEAVTTYWTKHDISYIVQIWKEVDHVSPVCGWEEWVNMKKRYMIY